MAVHVVEDSDGLQALANPLRLQVLEALREPASAASVARAVGEARQKINYHLKELERTGLVRKVGERKVGAFTEALFQAVASTIVVSQRAAWSDDRRAQVLRDQASLEHLVGVGERLERDAAALLDRATFEGEEVASASVEADVRFADEAARSAFMEEYLQLLGPLLKKHGGRKGDPYRVAIAVYPEVQR